jgi:prophage antirepressor-like protein
VSVIEKDGEPWFIANEVCQVLEIVNTSDAIKNLDEDEKGIAKIYTLEENRKY